MLNPSKSRFLWCSSPRRVLLLDRSAFVLRDGSVDVSSVVRNLGAFFDITMSMNDHINRLVRASCYQLRRIKSIRHDLPKSTTIQLVNSFIISRVDYCNSILAGVPKYQLDRLQSILNVAARLIFDYTRYDHITPLLRDQLHWLRVTQCIDFKRCLMVFKALHGLASGYISDYCVRVSTNQRRSNLRSASHNCLVVPPPSMTITFGERSFGICGPTTWNSLPDSVKDADSFDVLKSLKTYLFGLSYG